MGNQLFWAMFDLAAFLKRVRLATCKPPENLPKAIEDLGEELEVSPWESWMLICLDRYRQRQLWALDFAFSVLMPSIPEFEKSLESEGELSGFVPSAPDWAFHLCGRNCTLDNRVIGQRVAVQLYDRYREPGIDEFEFIDAVEDLKADAPPSCGKRLRELHPSTPSLMVTFGHLRAAKAFEFSTVEGIGHEQRLSREIVDISEVFSDFCTKWQSSENRLWLAACVGDWSAVEQFAKEDNQPAVASLAAERAQGCRERRIAILDRHWCNSPGDSVYMLNALCALEDAGADNMDEYVRKAFDKGKLAARQACTYVIEKDRPEFCPQVYRVFQVMTQQQDMRSALSYAPFLLEKEHKADEVFAAVWRNSRIDALRLAIPQKPELVFRVVEDGLRSTSEYEYRTCAAILALLADARSERICSTAMKQSDDPLVVAYCQMALFVMWKKEDFLSIYEAVRRWMRSLKKRRFPWTCLEGWDTRHIRGASDLLAELFLSTVEDLRDLVLSNRDKVLSASEDRRTDTLKEIVT